MNEKFLRPKRARRIALLACLLAVAGTTNTWAQFLYDETQLTNLFTNGGTGTLGANISITSTLTIPSGKSVTLNSGTGNTISRGSATGTIIVEGTLTMNGITFDGKKANYTATSAGIIVEDGGSLSLTNCTVKDCNNSNTNSPGGGIRVQDRTSVASSVNVSFTGCTISGNQACIQGGGVSVGKGNKVSFVDTHITDNTLLRNDQTTYQDGGGLYAYGLNSLTTTITYTRGSISGNLLQNGYANPSTNGLSIRGCAVFLNRMVDMTMTDVTVEGNKCKITESGVGVVQGLGTIYGLSNASEAPKLEIYGCTIQDNGDNGDASLSGLQRYLLTGGGIYWSCNANSYDESAKRGLLKIDKSTANEHTCFRGNYASYGGGIYLYGGKLECKNTVFEENNTHAYGRNGLGGGIYVESSSTSFYCRIEIEDCHFEKNKVRIGGSGIYVQMLTYGGFIKNCEFTQNDGPSTLHIKKNFPYTQATVGYSLALESLSFTENSGSSGVVYVETQNSSSYLVGNDEQNALTLKDVTITGNNNNSTYYVGATQNNNGYLNSLGLGVISAHNTKKLTVNLENVRIDNNVFNKNYRYPTGAVQIRANSADAQIDLNMDGQSTVKDNKSIYGGGVHVRGNGTVRIIGSTDGSPSEISGNRFHSYGSNAQYFMGGGVYVEMTGTGSCTLQNLSITKNGHEDPNDNTDRECKQGGGICLYSGTLTVKDCYIGGNKALEDGGGIYNNENCTLNLYGGNVIGEWGDVGAQNVVGDENNAQRGWGAGVFVKKNATTNLQGVNTIMSNRTLRTDPKPNNEEQYDNLCLERTAQHTGLMPKLTITGALHTDGAKNVTRIGITEYPVETEVYGYTGEESTAHQARQFTIDYETHEGTTMPDTYFHSDNEDYVVEELESSLSTTGITEATLGINRAPRWYVAGIIGPDDNGIRWGDDDNSGRYPDLPKRTLTGTGAQSTSGTGKGVFASGYNPEEEQPIFVVRALDSRLESVSTHSSSNGNTVVIRFPESLIGSSSWGAIPDEQGTAADRTLQVKLYRYPGGHSLSSGETDLGTATNASTHTSSTTPNGGKPGPNFGAMLLVSSEETHNVTLRKIHFDGLESHSEIVSEEFNPLGLKIVPKCPAIIVENNTHTLSGNTVQVKLLEECHVSDNHNVGPGVSGTSNGNAYNNGSGNSTLGGGIYCAGKLYAHDLKVMNDSCYTDGGGIYVEGTGNMVLSECTVEENEAAGNGGGIYIKSGGTVELSTSTNVLTVKNNTASSNGGGVYIDAGAAMSINGSGQDGVLINYNHATKKGGGVYKLGSLSVAGLVVITDNTASLED